MPIKAIIFDMDGVLIDSIHVHFLGWKKAVSSFGRTYTLAHFNKQHGKSNKDIAKAICHDLRLDVSPKELGELKHKISRSMLSKIKLFPGVITTLISLNRRGIALGLATASNRSTTDAIWDKFGFERYFKVRVCSDDVKRAKPAPDLFLLCAKRLGIRPENCLVLEDSYLGIEAAKRCGMMSVGITNTYPARMLSAADKIIIRITELNTIIVE